MKISKRRSTFSVFSQAYREHHLRTSFDKFDVFHEEEVELWGAECSCGNLHIKCGHPEDGEKKFKPPMLEFVVQRKLISHSFIKFKEIFERKFYKISFYHLHKTDLISSCLDGWFRLKCKIFIRVTFNDFENEDKKKEKFIQLTNCSVQKSDFILNLNYFIFSLHAYQIKSVIHLQLFMCESIHLR